MKYRLKDNDLVLVRHAPVETKGILYGRTDVGARIPSDEELHDLKSCLADARHRVTSPALRCRQTASAIWGESAEVREYPDLWEQSFGEWEGKSYDALPDIGPLSGDALAAHAASGGESFNDVCARAAPTLRNLMVPQTGPTVAVVHAGIVRACIALAVGSPAAALLFEVDCLSLSRFSMSPDGTVVVRDANTRF